MNTCYNVVRYMDTSAATYRLVSAACNLPFMDLKYNFLVRHLQPGISIFEWLVGRKWPTAGRYFEPCKGPLDPLLEIKQIKYILSMYV